MNMNLEMDTDTSENMDMDTDVDADTDCRLCPVHAYWSFLIHVHIQLPVWILPLFSTENYQQIFSTLSTDNFQRWIWCICKELLIVRDVLREKSTVNIQSYFRCQRTIFSAYYNQFMDQINKIFFLKVTW